MLDDLQWCDAETLSWLPMFLELADGYPVQVLAGVRDEQMPGTRRCADDPADLRAAGRVGRDRAAAAVAEATAALAGARPGRQPSRTQDAGRWHEATGGIPLFVIETARSKRRQEPSASEVGHLPRVQAVLHARLQEVSDAGPRGGGLAAAFGRAFWLELLTEASDHSEDVIVDAVDELWRRRIIRGARRRDVRLHARPAARRRVRADVPAAAAAAAPAGSPRRSSCSPAATGAAWRPTLAEQYDRAHAPKRAIRNYALAAEEADRGVRLRRRRPPLPRARSSCCPTSRPDASATSSSSSLLHAMSLPLNAIEGYASSSLRANLERSAVLARAPGRAAPAAC